MGVMNLIETLNRTNLLELTTYGTYKLKIKKNIIKKV